MLFALAVLCAVVVLSYIRVFLFTGHEVQEEGPGFRENAECSFFVYLCGSSLESRQGLAGQNIDELLTADIPNNVNVIIETGGAEEWHSHGISNQKLQRYIIEDKKLKLVSELADTSMGSADTFSDFLKWGREAYPAERNYVVMWDHGGSSAEGVCFDEKYGYDCLDRSELKEAFSSSGIQGYDMLIFDACYMGSIETADIASDYFRYMVASQKVIPGGGMDYKEIIGALNKKDDAEIGRIICDSFYEKCKEKHVEADVQLSLFDLKGTEPVIEAIDSAGENLLLRQQNRSGSFGIIEAASNSIVGGAGEEINVVDLFHFMDTAVLIDIKAHRFEVEKTIEELVPYQVKGENAECNGVSLYYPVHYDESQLENYLEVCPIGNYRTLLKNVYSSVPEEPLEFEDRGSINKDGDFEVKLTRGSRPYLFTVNRILWKAPEGSSGRFQLLGEEVVGVFDTGVKGHMANIRFRDSFDGKWYYLGGSPLLTKARARHLTTSYSAPVRVNGRDLTYTFVRSNLDMNGTLSHGILSEDFDRYGLPSRHASALKKGDKVEVYNAVDERGELTSLQKAFNIDSEADGQAEYLPLPEGRYRLQYVAGDILGNTIASDYALLEINDNSDDRIKVTEIREAY